MIGAWQYFKKFAWAWQNHLFKLSAKLKLPVGGVLTYILMRWLIKTVLFYPMQTVNYHFSKFCSAVQKSKKSDRERNLKIISA